MTIKNESTPARRVEDKRAAVPLEWNEAAQPAPVAAGLTDEQIAKLWRDVTLRDIGTEVGPFARAIEAAVLAAPASADNPSTAGAAPAAWMHEDGRVVPASTMAGARKDGGAILSSLRGYTIPLVAAQAIHSTAGAAKGAITSTWPERIWLQHGCEDLPTYADACSVFDGVTWCEDHINREDVEYVRADLAAPALNPSEVRDQALEDAAEALDVMNDSSGDAAAYDQREQNIYELEREHAISDCAKAIRALKSSAIKAADQQGALGEKGGEA